MQMMMNLHERANFGGLLWRKGIRKLWTPSILDNDNVHIDTTIKYEDGRQAHIKIDLHIRKIEP